MRRIILAPVDSSLGRSLFQYLSKNKRFRDFEIVGLSINDEEALSRPEEFEEAVQQTTIFLFELKYKLAEAQFALNVLDEVKFKEHKTFILLSSFMTWVKTQKNDPEEAEEEGGPSLPAPFTEDDRKKRCPHQLFRDIIRFERLAAAKNGTHRNRLHTSILCNGHLYGDGEDAFHFWFRQAWEGPQFVAKEGKEDTGAIGTKLPIYGEGNNTLPCIHVRDVCQIAGHVITEPPSEPLLICVDEGRYTQKQIVETISKKLGTGETIHIDEDKYLQMPHTPYLVPDVPMIGNIVHSFEDITWHCPNLIKNIDM
ncbi:MAG: putative Ak7-A-prov protein, partial [Streblomastix strix]